MVAKGKTKIPSDVSLVVLEHHARNLGMDVQELIDRLSGIEGKSTAEKIRKLYEEVQEQRREQFERDRVELVLGRVYENTIQELENMPGKYRMVVDIFNPSAEKDEEKLIPGFVPNGTTGVRRYVTLFAWEQTKNYILSAPLGATLSASLRYDENYDSWTVSAYRVDRPKEEYLQQLCDVEATDVDWSKFDPNDRVAVVYFRIDPQRFDVDTVFRETRDGSPMVKVVAPYENGFLTLNIFDVDHLPGDPWTEWKSYPVVYAVGRLYRVRDGNYSVSVSRVFVPVGESVEEGDAKDVLADKVVSYLKKKPKGVSTVSAVAKALDVPEGDVVAVAKEDPRLSVDDDGVISLVG